MSSNIEIDVRNVEPAKKHPMIFQKFEEVGSGESIVLITDHEPEPLYFQFSTEYSGRFEWEYLKQGPEVWKVEITKLSEKNNHETIGEIVARDFRNAEVFNKYNLDFCCGGEKTLEQVCKEADVNVQNVRNDLEKVKTNSTNSAMNRFNQWEPDFLVDYIINNHHSYVKKSLSEMPQYVEKVGQAHGETHPETIQISKLFHQLGQELASHLQKEEHILFPTIKKLVAFKKGQDVNFNFPINHIHQPMRMMEMEHDTAGNILKEIRRLSNDYKLPDDACATFEMVYNFLQEFEADLHQHIHLENNILFPKAIEQAKQVTAA